MSQDSGKVAENIAQEVVEVIRENAGGDAAATEVGQYFEGVLEQVFVEKRAIFIQMIREKLSGMAIADSGAAEENTGAPWIEISSLSRLRSVVGGRFQNLKSRWIEAGFPLREHRGDKGGAYELNQDGWIELSNWIAGQGYEGRLADSSSKHLFEVRKRE